MNYQKKAQKVLRDTIRAAGGEKTFEINGRNLDLLRMLERMVESGQIVEVGEHMVKDGQMLYTYRLADK
jgi:hypothetical protein